MDEGKPTKPKWWSRPRTHGPDSAPADPVSTGDGASGVHGADMDGDFELEKPAGTGPGTGPGTAATAVGDAGAGAGPTAVGDAGTGAGSTVAQAAGEVGDGVSAPAPGRRTGPLHDPDPYSTPPYGGPGPWAPAPPVQHPATTPAHGTTVEAAAPPQDAPPQPQDTPGEAVSGTPTPSAPAPRASAPSAPASHAPASSARAPQTPAPHAPAAHPNSPQTPAPHLPAPRPAVPGAHFPETRFSETPFPETPASGTPVPQTQGVLGPEPPGGRQAPGASPGAGENGAPAPAPSTPWQNYDPWAAAPLQHHGAAAEAPGGRRGRTGRALVLGAALLALVSGGVGGAVGAYLERTGGIDDVELPQAGVEAEGRAPDSVAGIAASALPGVVTLHVSGSDAQGTGTGFVLDRRGHILTNNHVVEPADGSGEITVTFSGGETAKAEVVGHDSGYDLAVVKVAHVSGLKPLSLGNSDNVQVGDPVVAIGAPFDLENTVTAGIISAKERPITAGGEEGDGSDISYVDALQTDAPINPGNSGGPLVDSKARVIGINSAIRSADSGSDLEGGQSGSIGLGFAIPINQGRRVAEELINTGKATHPVIGVTLDMEYSGDGARVGTKGNDGGSAVTRGGPGARAGIEAGDVITEVDGQRVHSGEELIVKTRSHRPGDRLELTLERDGRERKVTLVLGSADGD
ncbi:protease [Streptomyces dioscori]|uniref:Protease n=1 Tax=Streptomyces dioscori TaxID=2109333 RepID=A0A2P8Q007_9ACTN|nr:trypsin-like peptidase domain-containing protein [Streptomyces dioscori]PSM39582.1 protease [Streptomyces dioscori]